MVAKNIGESVLRKEDARFITGKGNYTDDINLRGQAHAFFVRASVARAMITSLDCSAAEAADEAEEGKEGDEKATEAEEAPEPKSPTED